MDRQPLDFAAILRGAFRGFAVLFFGALLHPVVALSFSLLGYFWLLLVAVVAFGAAAVVATPPGTPLARWRQAPLAALFSYALIAPLVLIATGSLPVLQAVLTTLTAVCVGAVVGVARIWYHTSQPVGRRVSTAPVSDA